VLVEEQDGAVRTSYVNLLRRSGIEAIGCGGPGAATRDVGPCPAPRLLRTVETVRPD